MTKKIVLGVVALLLVVGVSAYIGLLFGNKTITNIVESVGGTTTHDLGYWYKIGGVMHYAQSQTMKTSTTTMCALQGPAASSTLVFATANFKTASTSAITVTIAKSATAFATTTQIGSDYAIVANGYAKIIASTTPKGGLDGTTNFTGGQWLVVAAQGGAYTSSPYSPTGTCQAEWITNE